VHPLENKFLAFVRKNSLVQPGEKVLLAVSGGADSIAMLALFEQVSRCIPCTICVAHLNHKIRGKSAAGDALFVKDFAQQRGVPCFSGESDVPQLAKKMKISLEMAARKARYDFLIKTAHQHRCLTIATAHTANDQAETILMRLARGSSVEGLAGIPVVDRRAKIKIVRPLLTIGRKEIVNYLKTKKIKWREDETNKDTAILRNKIRHKVLPYLQKTLNPKLLHSLNRIASIARVEEEWISTFVENARKECLRKNGESSVVINKKLIALHPALQRRLLKAWLIEMGMPCDILDLQIIDELIETIKKAQADKKEHLMAFLNYRISASPDKTVLSLILKNQNPPLSKTKKARRCLKIPGTTYLPAFNIKVTATFKKDVYRLKPDGIGKYPAMASISERRRAGAKIVVRHWQAGDRMNPYGMAGSKKLQDIFMDQKIEKERRNHIPIFICRNKVIWIPGYRISEDWKVQPDEPESLRLLVEPTSR
jgi:tRNA(Ile)-lysidine synthase